MTERHVFTTLSAPLTIFSESIRSKILLDSFWKKITSILSRDQENTNLIDTKLSHKAKNSSDNIRSDTEDIGYRVKIFLIFSGSAESVQSWKHMKDVQTFSGNWKLRKLSS